MLLGEFTRLSWVRVLATAGVCHRCMGGTSGPRYRRGVFAATPAGARYGSRLKVPPPQKRGKSSWLLAILIEIDAPLLPVFLDVCSARCPDSTYMLTRRHATSVIRNTSNALSNFDSF